jgi:hypothetical protein
MDPAAPDVAPPTLAELLRSQQRGERYLFWIMVATAAHAGVGALAQVPSNLVPAAASALATTVFLVLRR